MFTTVHSSSQQSFSPPEYLRAATDVIFVYYEHSLFAIIIVMIIRINDNNSRHFKEKPKCSNIREKNLPWEIVTKVILFCNPNYFVSN